MKEKKTEKGRKKAFGSGKTLQNLFFMFVLLLLGAYAGHVSWEAKVHAAENMETTAQTSAFEEIMEEEAETTETEQEKPESTDNVVDARTEETVSETQTDITAADVSCEDAELTEEDGLEEASLESQGEEVMESVPGEKDNEETVPEESEFEEEKEEEDSPSSFCIAEPLGDISQDFLNQTNEALSVIPESLRAAFVENGWHFYVSEADVGSTYAPEYGVKMKGLTILELKVIYLDYRDSALTAAVHEFGHFLDEYLGSPSLGEEFAAIYQSECKIFNSTFSYKAGNVRELFAEGFKRYCTEKNALQSKCPQIYDFLNELLA